MKKREHMLKQAMIGAKELFEVPSSIQIFSNKQAVIQGAQGILEYTDERIRIRYGKGEACFYGSQLCIGCLSSDSLEISGRIERLEYV